MKLLLDESIPRNLLTILPDYFEIDTVQQRGWSGIKNGELLRLVEEHEYNALITADSSISHQHNFKKLNVVVIVLKAFRTHINFLSPLVPRLIELLENELPNGVHVLENKKQDPIQCPDPNNLR